MTFFVKYIYLFFAICIKHIYLYAVMVKKLIIFDEYSINLVIEMVGDQNVSKFVREAVNEKIRNEKLKPKSDATSSQ